MKKLNLRRATFITCLFLAAGIILAPFTSCAQTIGGIGAALTLDSAGGYKLPFIKTVLPNSPASKSLKENLFIQSVNGISCKDKTLEEIVAMIRGDVGTNIKIRASDDKQGLYSAEYSLVRAAIATQAANAVADPVAAFNSDCENGIRQLKRQGLKIVKNYSSECGDFFFNFDAQNGLYHVRLLVLAGKDYGLNASVFDNKYARQTAINLSAKGTRDFNGYVISELDGDISFTKDGVGVVSTKIPADKGGKCVAMYVVVYR